MKKRFNLNKFALFVAVCLFVGNLFIQRNTGTLEKQNSFEFLTLPDQTQKETTNDYAPVNVEELPPNVKSFISRFAPTAKAEASKYGIPASIKMAQAIIESRAGESRLAVNNNNYFGIKCFSRTCSKGHCTNASDDHHKDFFRVYESPWASFRAHSEFLQGERYVGLKKYGKDYKQWARGLKEAGYATDKRYDVKLINTIEKYKLYTLDN